MQPNNCNKWSWPHCHQTQVIQSFHQVAPICTHMVLRPPHLKRHLNSLIHFCRVTLHIPYTVQEAARCPSKTAPSPGRGGSGPPHNEVVLPDISVAHLAHRHTGHYSRALKWSKYIYDRMQSVVRPWYAAGWPMTPRKHSNLSACLLHTKFQPHTDTHCYPHRLYCKQAHSHSRVNGWSKHTKQCKNIMKWYYCYYYYYTGLTASFPGQPR